MSHSDFEARRAPYQLLVLDIDGTLTGPDGRMSEKNASAVRRLQYRGTPVTLATGRSERSTAPIARALGIHTPIITYNGGRIVDPHSGAVLMERRIPWAEALAVCRALLADESPLALYVYTDGAILGLAGTAAGGELLLTQDSGMLLNMRNVRQVESYAAAHPSRSPLKLMIGGDPSELDRVSILHTDKPGPSLAVVQSEPQYVEILPAGSTKGSALEWLAGHLRIPMDQIVTMGNAPNDIEMLRVAGVSVAVSDAHPDVIAIADLRAPASGADAVASTIDRLFPLWRPSTLPSAHRTPDGLCGDEGIEGCDGFTDHGGPYGPSSASA